MPQEFYPRIHIEPRHYALDSQWRQALSPAPVCERSGSLPVIVTSVHGHAHCREGVSKPADEGSLALSSLLAHVVDAHWLGVGQPDEPDSNHHQRTAFKQRLAEAAVRVKPLLIVDIHGAHAGRPFDVDIGSLSGQSWGAHAHWAAMLLQLLRTNQFLTTDNAVFRARGSTPQAQTVTAFAYEELNVPAVQLEISSALCADLNSRLAFHAHAKLVNALADFLLRVAGR